MKYAAAMGNGNAKQMQLNIVHCTGQANITMNNNKNTIRDRGSTVLYAALLTWFTLLTWFPLLTLLMGRMGLTPWTVTTVTNIAYDGL